MRNLLSYLSLAIMLVIAIPAKSDNVVVIGAANVSSNLVATPIITDSITVTATSANITTVRFYDSATTTTNYIQGAYTSYSSYATNYSVIFTNANSFLVTNTFVGVYTLGTVNAASTNTLPLLYTIIVPASAERVKVVKIGVLRGLVAVPNQNCIIEVDYHRNP